jgi:hypothetical protein
VQKKKSQLPHLILQSLAKGIQASQQMRTRQECHLTTRISSIRQSSKEAVSGQKEEPITTWLAFILGFGGGLLAPDHSLCISYDTSDGQLLYKTWRG